MPPTTEITPESCQSCGACCGNHDPSIPEWAGPLSPLDYARLPQELRGQLLSIGEGDVAGLYMPNVDAADGGRCSQLVGTMGVGVECAIYEQRPEACRSFEPGSTACRDARILRGVDALHPLAQLVRERRARLGL